MSKDISEFVAVQRIAIKQCVDAYEEDEWMPIGVLRLENACDIIDQLQATIDNLKKALKKHGSHSNQCDSHNTVRRTIGMGVDRPKCDCGFKQALKGGV